MIGRKQFYVSVRYILANHIHAVVLKKWRGPQPVSSRMETKKTHGKYLKKMHLLFLFLAVLELNFFVRG